VAIQAEVRVISREFCARAGRTRAHEAMTATNKEIIRMKIGAWRYRVTLCTIAGPFNLCYGRAEFDSAPNLGLGGAKQIPLATANWNRSSPRPKLDDLLDY